MLKRLLTTIMFSFLILAAAEESVHPIATPDTARRYRMAKADATVKAPGYDRSMLWEFSRSPRVTITPFPADFLHFGGTQNNALELWLHEERPQDTAIILFIGSENTGTKDEDYYSLRIPLDFTGWKRLVIPFAEMTANRDPLGWERITRLTLHAKGWSLPFRPEASLRIGRIGLLAAHLRPGPRLQDEEFYRALNLELPGLEQTRAAVQRGDYAAAEHCLAEYFRRRATPRWKIRWQVMPSPARRPKRFDTTKADAVVKHLLTSVGVPHQFGERIDWSINPTKLQYREWTWQLSRHACWKALQEAYWATGDEIYAREFNDQMIAWVEDNPSPATHSGNLAGSRWRTIETGIRTLGAWPSCFFGFLSSPSFTDHGIVTMLKSFYEHGCHLRRHPTRGNWLAMEMNGLFATAVLFPEFRDADEWRRFALEKLYAEMEIQVYPDGAQTELAPGYHGVSLNCFLNVADLAALNGIQLPADYLDRLEKMFEYYVKIAMPDLRMPALNDSGWGSVTGRMQAGYKLFPRQRHFQYLASKRAHGAPPNFTSAWMPYAGWAILRSGWGPRDAYLHFDAGPFSTGHSHEDKLSFVIHAKGSLLLTEGGVYAYDTSQWRRYVLSSYAHNLTLVDGMQQHRRVKDRRFERVDTPLPNVFLTNATYDFAEGWFNEGYGPDNDTSVTHYRAFLFVKPDFWVMFDIFTPKDDRTHTYETIFHLENKEASVDRASLAVTGTDARRANLAILPAAREGLSVAVVKGQEKPVVQGWVPAEGYEVRPIPTPVYTRTAAGQIVEPYVLWPLAPGEPSPVRGVDFADRTLTVRLADGTVHRFTLELAGARIASIQWNGQRIQVRRAGGRGARASAIPSARRP